MTIVIQIECPTWVKRAVTVIAPLVFIATAGAAFSVPNTFSPGQTIKSADMNANFAALESEIAALQTAVQAAKVPAGTVAYYAAKTCPSGWLEANGASVSSTTYPDLFAAIANSFGGTAPNFQLPQLDGEFIRGWDNGRGVDPGRTFGTFEYGSSVALDGYVNGSAANATATGYQDRLAWNNQFDAGFQSNVAPGTAVNGVTVPAAGDPAHITEAIAAGTAGTVAATTCSSGLARATWRCSPASSSKNDGTSVQIDGKLGLIDPRKVAAEGGAASRRKCTVARRRSKTTLRSVSLSARACDRLLRRSNCSLDCLPFVPLHSWSLSPSQPASRDAWGASALR